MAFRGAGGARTYDRRLPPRKRNGKSQPIGGNDDALNPGLISADIHASVKKLLHTRNSVARRIGQAEVRTVQAKNFSGQPTGSFTC